ncbi:hypothetical protein E6H11_02370 [Candidatus Bathyarchaeota archaeon]|nr:MAG: hypothetical protein E6H11_02370 [Candidatus Bathyarchaeota archaeon]
MVEEIKEARQREELLANIQRLSRIVLDRLEEGSKEGTLDQAQIRLLGSIAVKSLGLWQEALNPRPRRGLRGEAWETEEQLSRQATDKGDQA